MSLGAVAAGEWMAVAATYLALAHPSLTCSHVLRRCLLPGLLPRGHPHLGELPPPPSLSSPAATYYAGAYYLGYYRGGIHSWENFAASGSAAGLGVALWLIRPLKVRPVAFGVMLGGLLGGAGAAAQQVRGGGGG